MLCCESIVFDLELARQVTTKLIGSVAVGEYSCFMRYVGKCRIGKVFRFLVKPKTSSAETCKKLFEAYSDKCVSYSPKTTQIIYAPSKKERKKERNYRYNEVLLCHFTTSNWAYHANKFWAAVSLFCSQFVVFGGETEINEFYKCIK